MEKKYGAYATLPRLVLPEAALPLIILHCPFSRFYFAASFDYWTSVCVFELGLRRHSREILAELHITELFSIPPLHRLFDYMETPCW